MSVIITTSAVLGPFKSVEVLTDRLRCDNTDLPFTVIGSYTISEDDSLAPPPPAPKRDIQAEIAALEAQVTNRRIREAIRGNGKVWLDEIDDQIAALRAQL